MNGRIASLQLGLTALCVLLPAGCAAQQPTDRMDQLGAIYRQAIHHREQSMRWPVRQRQDRYFTLLAQKADEMLAETEGWQGDVELSGSAKEGESAAPVSDFRQSLQGLRAAAARSDIPAVHGQYARASASYQRLLKATQ